MGARIHKHEPMTGGELTSLSTTPQVAVMRPSSSESHELVLGLAHELNQVFGAIVLNSEAALELGLPMSQPLLSQRLAKINELSIRGGELIRQMRTSVRNGAAERELADLNVIVIDALHWMKHAIDEGRITVEIQSTTPPPPVAVDRALIQLVLVNLLQNAVDAMRTVAAPSKRIVILIQSLRSSVRISVEDRGIGLEESVGRNLFEPHPSIKRGGMGIGLSLCRSVIESHGGTIDGLANTNEGMTFYFELPVPTSDNDAIEGKLPTSP